MLIFFFLIFLDDNKLKFGFWASTIYTLIFGGRNIL